MPVKKTGKVYKEVEVMFRESEQDRVSSLARELEVGTLRKEMLTEEELQEVTDYIQTSIAKDKKGRVFLKHLYGRLRNRTKIYLYPNRTTKGAKRFRSRDLCRPELEVYIRKLRMSAKEITAVSFCYSPLTEEDVERLPDRNSLKNEYINVEEPIFDVLYLDKVNRYTVKYDPLSHNRQVGKIFMPKPLLGADRPKAIIVLIGWIYAPDGFLFPKLK